MYLYDRGGNLTGYLSAPYTLAPSIDGVTEMVFYSYDDANWKDKVTAIGGKAITYDAIGNPLTYDGWTFTWKAGRMLASMVKTGTNAQFTYDHNGLRIRKVVNGVTTNYTLNGKNIVHMTQGSNDLHFFYDEQGKPAMVRFNGTDYFYIYNLQGDVVAMIDVNGTQVVEYHYDAWGNPVAKTGSMVATLGTVNPFRYRGYVYDEETGLYYLRSRYYNPVWKRFINADHVLMLSKKILRCNAFAYCVNNPTIFADEDGYFNGYIPITKARKKMYEFLISKYTFDNGAEPLVTSVDNFLNRAHAKTKKKYTYDDYDCATLISSSLEYGASHTAMTRMFRYDALYSGTIDSIGGKDGLIPGMIVGQLITEDGKTRVEHGGIYAGEISLKEGQAPVHAVYQSVSPDTGKKGRDGGPLLTEMNDKWTVWMWHKGVVMNE